jgi:GT2 family glycosyltransferase
MNKNRPSIIIVNWNTHDFLTDCLSSLEAKRTEESEVIVVASVQKDHSMAWVRSKFPCMHLAESEGHIDFAAASNQAMETALGEYVLLLNSDALVPGEVLAQCCDFIDAERQVGVMGCEVLNGDASLHKSRSSYPHLLNLFLLCLGVTRIPARERFDRFQMRYRDRNET